MEEIYTDPHMENKNTEHVRRKQLSSILKAPRNPLDDLGNGSELTQGVSTEKRRRTLHRVSFANTVNCRVFERDLENNTEGGTGGAADAENDVLPHQSEEPGAASCEITGMNTLLHAPIQAVVQQTEAQDGDSSIHRANRQDTTLLLPEDNEMDMTASHTTVIAQDLGSSQAEQPKMDITSLPPGAEHKEAKAAARAQVRFFSDLPTLSCPGDGQQGDVPAVKKINFSEFFMSFKSKRTLRSAEGPQYASFPPLQASEDAAQFSREFVCSHEQLDSCDVTRVFGEQDGGMELTKCQASAIRATFPAPCEAPAQQFPCTEVTSVFADNEMDMTSSHTAKVSFPFTVGNRNLNFPKDSPPPEAGSSMFKRASNRHLTVQREQLCADRRATSAEDRQDPAALQAARQEARGVAAVPGSIFSETVFRGGPPPVCEDMEITGDYTGVVSDRSSRHQSSEQPASRCPAGGDRAPGSQTAPDSPAPGPCKPLKLSSGSEGRLERVSQGHSSAPGNAWLDSCRSSVSAGVPQSRLQPRLSSCLVSLPTEKTLILSEDMDLTKTSIVRGDGRDAENESPAAVFTSVTCKPQFVADRAPSPSLNEQEEMEMTKCHVVVIDDQCKRVTTGGKEMYCEIIPRKSQNKSVSEGTRPLDVDKENVEVLGVDGNLRRSQAVEIRAKGLEVMKAYQLERTNFQASGPSSSANSVCSLQKQKREVPEDAVTSTSGSVSLQSQKVLSQPLGRSLLEASVSEGTVSGFKALPCAGERATTFSAGAAMDMARSHPVPGDYWAIWQHRSAGDDSPSPSGDQTCVFTYSDDMEMTALSAVDEPMEKAVPQGMLSLAKRTRRRSLKKAAGEETVWFSLDAENNDMDITQSHTAAIGHEILSQNKGGPCSVSSADAVNPVLFPGSQAAMAITKPCSGAPSTSHLVCADSPSLAQEAGQQAHPSSEATLLAVDDMEITTALNRTVEENALPGAQPLTSSTIVFQSFQADMEMTQSHSLGESIRRAFCEDRAQLAKQEAVPGSRSIIFSSAEDMEITRTLTGVLRGGASKGVKVPLGIFQPKLPNRRASASSVQDTNAKSSVDKGEAAAASDTCVRSRESPGPGKPGRQNFSPSRFVAEEFLPVYLEEMDPNESVSCELMESACSERIPDSEKNPFEKTKTCSKPKRAMEQDEDGLHSPKKVKSDENLHAETSPDLQVTVGAVSQSQAEVHEGEDPPALSAQSLDCTHASTSSSLDSVKADAEFTIQRSSQVESQLLICEDNLREKFQSGLITVGEFLTLLQVHIPIQRPRHSHIPSSGAGSAPPTQADLLHRQYILRPRLRVYEEDCRGLAQKIEELKLHVSVQDQLLVNFNRTLWEVMRTCSDEELKKFGAELNQMKSYFTKESKIQAHKEKAELYSKLLQSVQEQQGKIQSRAEELEELLKEAKSCLGAPGADSAWEEWEAECSDEMPGVSFLERELENIKSQEEELERELSEVEAENEQMLVRMKQLEEEEKHYQELLEKSESTEWDLIEWNEQQGVFSFLYDSVELTVIFEPPGGGDEFGTDPSRKILSLSFESLLDEAAAPPSSRLVHRLIFQFIASQGCWQEKCPTLHHLPQVLRDISSVVSNCRILGDEVEFLERWGGKFKLLKTDVSDTNLKLLFSSAAAFAKFQLTLSLAPTYPHAPLPFTVQKLIGNVGEEEVSAVLSAVPTGLNYLQRIVSSVHQELLRGPS